MVLGGFMALGAVPVVAQTLPDALVLQIDADNNGTTDTMRLAKRSVRGPYLQYFRGLSSGTYTLSTPPQARTFRGTIDGRPDMQVCAVVMPDGTLEFSGFDHTLGRGHILKRSGIDVSGQLVQAGPATANPVRPTGGLAEMPLGVDINYQQFAVVCAGSADLAWAKLEHQVNVYDLFMARDADVVISLGTVLTREWGELYFPTGTGNHLDIVRNHWLDTPDLRNSPWEQIFTYATSTGLFGTGGYAWQKQLGKIDTIDRSQGAIGSHTLWHESGGHNWDAKHSAYGRDTMGGNHPHHGPWNIERVLALRDARRAGGTLLSPGTPYPDPVPPFTYLDQVITTTGSPVQIQPLANDRDSNGDSITIRDFTATTENGGTVTRSGDTLTYTPAPGYIGKDIIAYTAQDNSSSALGARELIFIEVVNHGPTLHYPFEESSGLVCGNSTGLGHSGRIAGPDVALLSIRGPVGRGLALPAGGLSCGTEKTFPGAYTGVSAEFYPLDSEKMGSGNHFDPMTGNYSFSLWFRASDVASARSLVRKFADNGTGTGLRLRLESGRLNLALQALDGTRPYRSINGSATISPNQWYHAGVVIDRTAQAATLYLDGSSIGSMALGAGESYFNGREPLKLGGDGPDGLLVDEFRLSTAVVPSSTMLAHFQEGNKQADALPTFDADLDGLPNDLELVTGTDSLDADTDGDTFKDGLEQAASSDPLDENSLPNAIFRDMHAWWTFEETDEPLALDRSGNGRHSVVKGASRLPGEVGTSLNFDGVDDEVELASSTALTGTVDFTIGLWLRIPAGISVPMYILSQREPGSSGFQGSYAVQMDADGNVSFFIYNSGYQFNFRTSNIPLNDGQWHHLTLQREGSAGRIFVDGALKASASGTAKSLIARRVVLGRDGRDGGRYLSGMVDDLRIYQRALSNAEVLALANRAPHARQFNLSVTENFPAGTYVGAAITMDPDSGQTLSYRIADGNPDGAFTIDSTAGVITTTRPLDRESASAHQLTVEAADDSENHRATVCPVTITVRDISGDDSDTDGLDDEWELVWFGGPARAHPAADPDHDNHNNRMEFLTGSSPNDSSSVFRHTPSFAGTFSTHFAGLAGRSYALERSTSLTNNWTEVASAGPLAADLPVTLADPDPTPPPAAFYRIAISLP